MSARQIPGTWVTDAQVKDVWVKSSQVTNARVTDTWVINAWVKYSRVKDARVTMLEQLVKNRI